MVLPLLWKAQAGPGLSPCREPSPRRLHSAEDKRAAHRGLRLGTAAQTLETSPRAEVEGKAKHSVPLRIAGQAAPLLPDTACACAARAHPAAHR